MNRLVGKIGSLVTGVSVLSFAVSMIVALFYPSTFYSCLASIFIAIGFVPFMCALYSLNDKDECRAAGISGIAFAAIYATIILLVYYAECTTVRMNNSLSDEALSIISYGYLGSLFFNYDLLGYAFMALSTFLVSFTVQPRSSSDRALRWMLRIHGIFFFSCLIVPLFPVFTRGTGNIIGTVLLEIWCAYFLPICVLGYRYFDRAEDRNQNKA
ncbi:MAG TPA: hypothetical protein PK369_08020 [Thermoclostridium sp.]|nr:hypothetical protein [Thermoclostridium sp.]